MLPTNPPVVPATTQPTPAPGPDRSRINPGTQGFAPTSIPGLSVNHFVNGSHFEQ